MLAVEVNLTRKEHMTARRKENLLNAPTQVGSAKGFGK
jgi:hypothetical protein